MKYSQLFIPTMKEVPGEADVISHKLMVRAGFIRKLASGIYEWLPLGLRVLRKVETIIREEMDRIGGQEVLLPVLQPRALWEETGRWALYGKELMRLKDRHGREFALGPTHEEVITDIVRKDVRSYRQLPLILYQMQTKFRDEIRPRFGLMRAREFYMKDAYSFHRDEKDTRRIYTEVFEAYNRIFTRCGFRFRAVEAMTGAIGGSFSHEFMVLAETGEEGIVSCACGYAANTEKAEVGRSVFKKPDEEPLPMEDIHTPGQKTVEEVSRFLKAKPERFIKTLIYRADGEPVMVLVRGDREVEEHKLQAVIGCNELFLADEETIRRVTGAPLGFAGPHGSKKIRTIADRSVEFIGNGISGANRKDYHAQNIVLGRDYTPGTMADIARIAPGDRCKTCGKELEFSRGIEVGHTFMLGTKYSAAMKATYLDADGAAKEFVMGCYGIGISRIVAAAIEQNNDKDGIIWPLPIAPYRVIIVPVNYEEPKTRAAADRLYEAMRSNGIEVILDDRPGRAGFKFKDADLIGIPIRVTLSEKKLAQGNAEIKKRSKKESKDIPTAKVLAEIKKILSAETM